MNKRQRFAYYLLLAIGLSLTLAFGIWWAEPQHIPNNFHGLPHAADLLLYLLLSYVVWYQIISEVFLWTVVKDMKHPYYLKPQPGSRVAFLTAFVPGKEPYELLEKTLKAMVAVDYPHDTWLLDEGNDEVAKGICERYGVKHYSRKGVEKYNTPEGPYRAKTKGGNHNSWHDLHGHDYDYVAQIDVDFMPRKDFLRMTLGYFNDPEVGFVGTPQIYGNTDESWIAQGAAEQAYGFYGAMQKGFFGKNMQMFIGANHVVRVEALNHVGGYSGHIVEDHLTGMRIYTKRWKSVYVPEKLAIGEGPATWDAYFSQQMRWAYGLLDILFHHSPKLMPKMKRKHAINYFLLQQHYFYGFTQVLAITLLTFYFIFGVQATSMHLLPLLILYVPLLCWQLVFSLWLQRFSVDPQSESGLLLKGKLLTLAAWPIYFLAFLGVLTGKRLTYAVTPKGKQQETSVPLTLFLPHFVLGTVTAIDILASSVLHHQSGPLLFWAALNTFIMYSFVLYVASQKAMIALLTRTPLQKLAERAV
jgi:cellulose synthase/poly-beta-1,6-N-acetylglucosamine synthase-like glycosyltransferase